MLLKLQRREVTRMRREEKVVGRGGLASQRGASQKKRDRDGGLTYY